MDKFISVKDAAFALHISMRRVQALCKAGRLGAKVGGRYLITKKEVDLFIRRPAGNPKWTK
jgi:excisionase family DNA binding protein